MISRHLDELRKEGAGRGDKIITPPMPHIFAKYHNSVTAHGKPIIYPKIVQAARPRGRAYGGDRQDRVLCRGEGRARLRRRLHDHERRLCALPAGAGAAHHRQGLRDLLPDRAMDGHQGRNPGIRTQDLTVRTFFNDLEVCKAHTSEMLFSIRQFIASLSRVFPLEPGDVLATGSPPGPGMYHDPPMLAKVGDVMRIEIEKIGTLANPVVAAQR